MEKVHIDKNKLVKLISNSTGISELRVHTILGIFLSEVEKDILNSKRIYIYGFGRLRLRKYTAKLIGSRFRTVRNRFEFLLSEELKSYLQKIVKEDISE